MQLAKTLEEYEKDITEGRKHGLMGALKIGRALQNIDTGNLWVQTGCKNLSEYAEKTHGIKKSSCYSLIGVWQKWGEYILAHPELQQVDPTRLVRLLPLVDGHDSELLIHTALTVPSAKAFDDTIRELGGKVPTDCCVEHNFIPIAVERCSVCGLKRKIDA
jgi:hypothetical protein